MKQLEIIADSGHLDTLVSLAEHHEVHDHWYTHADDGKRNSFRMLVDDHPGSQCWTAYRTNWDRQVTFA